MNHRNRGGFRKPAEIILRKQQASESEVERARQKGIWPERRQLPGSGPLAAARQAAQRRRMLRRH